MIDNILGDRRTLQGHPAPLGAPNSLIDDKRPTPSVSSRSDLIYVFWCEEHALNQTPTEAPIQSCVGTVK